MLPTQAPFSPFLGETERNLGRRNKAGARFLQLKGDSSSSLCHHILALG